MTDTKKILVLGAGPCGPMHHEAAMKAFAKDMTTYTITGNINSNCNMVNEKTYSSSVEQITQSEDRKFIKQMTFEPHRSDAIMKLPKAKWFKCRYCGSTESQGHTPVCPVTL